MTPSPTLQAGDADTVQSLRAKLDALVKVMSHPKQFSLQKEFSGSLSLDMKFELKIFSKDEQMTVAHFAVLMDRLNYEHELFKKFNKPPNTTGDRDE